MNPMFNFILALTAVLAVVMANAAMPVYDVQGDPVVSGNSYYVLPAIVGTGGGLTLLRRNDDEQCLLDVVQSRFLHDKGFPVKFSNWGSRDGIVPESVNLNVETISSTICVQPNYWFVDEKNLVTTGPKPEGDSSKSFFQIKISKEFGAFAYTFASCPSVDSCHDTGIFVDKDGVRRLALSNVPLMVVFIKLTEGSSKTMSII